MGPGMFVYIPTTSRRDPPPTGLRGDVAMLGPPRWKKSLVLGAMHSCSFSENGRIRTEVISFCESYPLEEDMGFRYLPITWMRLASAMFEYEEG